MNRRQRILELWDKYNRRTSQNMTAYNKAGGNVRRPVRSSAPKSQKSKYDQAKFNTRKAAQILARKDPLVYASGKYKGLPTPAVLQFARWGVPLNYLEKPSYSKIRAILKKYQAIKEASRPKD